MRSESRGRSYRRRSVGPQSLAGLIALVVLVVLACGAFALSTLTSAATVQAEAGTTTGGDPNAGKSVYLSTCAACHGAHGEGSAVAPGLQTAGTALIDFMMRTGRMPLTDPSQPLQRGVALLTQQQIADVVAFLAPLTNGPAIPPDAVQNVDLAAGRGLFTANCAACHGATGAGNAIGGGIVAPDLHSSADLDVLEAILGGPPPMPRFSFAPDDLAAVNAYVQFLRHPPAPGGSTITGLGPVAEGLAAGLIGLIAILVIVLWVGRSSRAAQQRPAPARDQPFSAEPADEERQA